jgi:hypothetical protein
LDAKKVGVLSSFSRFPAHLTPSTPKNLRKWNSEVSAMQVMRFAPICVLMIAFTLSAAAQNPDTPALKTRPPDSAAATETSPDNSRVSPVYEAPPNAIPQGTHFLVRLMDALDTRSLEQGQHFRAELREDLVAPGGFTIKRGHILRAHVATFERGYTGARMMLAIDGLEFGREELPIIATVCGVPGDPSIKSTGQEGEITQRGPDKKRVITNAAIGAAIGAAAGASTGGTKGATAGAVAGAGLGTTTSFLMKGSDLKLEEGTTLEVRLDRDLMVPTR